MIVVCSTVHGIRSQELEDRDSAVNCCLWDMTWSMPSRAHIHCGSLHRAGGELSGKRQQATEVEEYRRGLWRMSKTNKPK